LKEKKISTTNKKEGIHECQASSRKYLKEFNTEIKKIDAVRKFKEE
jgi:hypothetical protein